MFDSNFGNSIREIQAGLKEKKFSPRELLDHSFKRIDETEKLNHIVLKTNDLAESALSKVEAEISSGELKPLSGIPMALKDLFVTEGARTTCSSHILNSYIPPYDSTVVRRLKESGSLIVAKTNMDEFAMGSSNENSTFGEVKNPWDELRVPGGSSGGSAVAVATGCSPVSMGTDTGGSIRQPASLTGVVGMKPTYGRVSRFGMIAYASSLDQAGPFGNTVDDCAHVLQSIAGHDPLDSTTVDKPVDDYISSSFDGMNSDSLKGVKVGLPKEFFAEGMDPEVEKIVMNSLENLKKAGAETVEISLPHSKASVAVYYVVAVSEASSNLARFDGIHYGHRSNETIELLELYKKTRAEGFGQEVKRRIILGTFALSSGYYDAYYSKACRVRRLIRNDFLEAFNSCDFIFAPVTPTTAFKLGEKTSDPLKMYLNDIYTIPVNLAGLPGITIPAGFDSNLPVGIQMIGKDFDEANLLKWASTFERENGNAEFLKKAHEEVFS
jgi:aspartyl-tRNA(Asn)/glutamyl-tRNA(Gln) amidotransferase subunit A